jgi:putative peptidoglycan lipid II flippase
MRLALVLGSISAVSLAAAFLIQSLILVIVGPGRETDALFAAMAVPQFVLAVVSGSLTSVLVPLLSNKPVDEARGDAWALSLLVAGVSSAISLPLALFAQLWAPLLFPGFQGEHLVMLVRLCRIQAFGMIFTAVWGVLSAFHQSQNHFIRVEASQVVSGVAIIAVLLLALPEYGIIAAGWLTAGRSAALVLLLLPGLGRFRCPREWSSTVRPVWSRLKPLLAGTGVYKTDVLVDRVLSAAAPAGGLSLFYFGQQLFSAVAQISGSAIANPLVPRLSGLAHRSRWVEFRSAVRSRLAIVIAILAIGYLMFLAVGRFVLEMFVGRGGVTPENVGSLFTIMIALGGFLLGAACGQITAVSFYAQGDTVTPTRIGIITFLLFVPVKIAAFLQFGLVGLAISVSAYFVSSFAIQYFVLESRLRTQILAGAGDDDGRERRNGKSPQVTDAT